MCPRNPCGSAWFREVPGIRDQTDRFPRAATRLHWMPMSPSDLALESHAENRGVLAHLAREAPAGTALVAPPSAVHDAYHECGSHPDVVEHVWDRLGAQLPRSSRVLLFGTPALLHSNTGIVLAVALGTAYALRLPTATLHDPAAASLEKSHTYGSVDMTLDLAAWGSTWRFGAYHRLEATWVQRAANEFDATRRIDQPGQSNQSSP